LFVAAATAVITSATITETQIRAGGQPIVVTLTNEAFVNPFDAAPANALFDALGSVSTPGWDELKSLVTFPSGFALSTVSTTDDTLTFTLPAAALITLSADEVLATLVVPASAVLGSAITDVSGNTVTLQDEGSRDFMCIYLFYDVALCEMAKFVVFAVFIRKWV
jgi:hypothetical protein